MCLDTSIPGVHIFYLLSLQATVGLRIVANAVGGVALDMGMLGYTA